MTTTSSTTSTTSSATQQILTSLNAGSGIDSASLVSSLVDAQFATRTDTLNGKSEALSSKVSDAATLLSSINGFSTSLATLVKSGTLTSQPTTSNGSVVGVTTLAGAQIKDLSVSLEVKSLASAQSAASAYVADPAVTGTGSFTLTFGKATTANGAMTGFTAGSGMPVTITIGEGQQSLTGVAAAINGAKAGVTATIITDANGSRLMLKSKTGAEQAFTLTASDTSSDALKALAIGVGTGATIGTAAADAVVAVDGIEVTRPTNTISDLVAGVKLDLLATSPTPVTIGSSTPSAPLIQVVNDFVDTYNELQAIIAADLDPATGSLASDSATRTLMTSLKKLTLAKLTSGTSGPATLAELGVSTNRDGTLSVDTAKLTTMVTTYPDAVEKMFALGTGSATVGNGLSAALAGIAAQASNKTYGLAASQSRYSAQQSDVSEQLEKIADQRAQMTTRLTQQFASMDSRVAAYKSTQTFLEQQIDAWNASNN